MLLLLLLGDTPPGYIPVTSTRTLQKPVNCVLAGQQPYESSYKTADRRKPNLKYSTRMKRGSLRDLLKGD